MNEKLSLGDNSKVTKFYPYAHVVVDEIFSIGYEGGDDYGRLREQVIENAIENGIEANIDNKIVFEITDTSTGIKLYYGFKDWHFRIGTGVHKLY